jgi:hypothetical protein
MRYSILFKSALPIQDVEDFSDRHMGTAIADDAKTTESEKLLKHLLEIYKAFALEGEPEAFITPYFASEPKKEAYLALVINVDEKLDENQKKQLCTIAKSRIETGLRDACDLQQQMIDAKQIQDANEKNQRIEELQQRPQKLKKIMSNLTDLKVAALQTREEDPDSLPLTTMKIIDEIAFEDTEIRSERTNEMVTFDVKISSISKGIATVNVIGKNFGFEKLTIDRMVDDQDFCDFFYHASLNDSPFKVSLMFDERLQSATSKTILTAHNFKFSFSREDIVKAIANRNSKEQFKMDFSE